VYLKACSRHCYHTYRLADFDWWLRVTDGTVLLVNKVVQEWHLEGGHLRGWWRLQTRKKYQFDD